jgi:hypothetical protein
MRISSSGISALSAADHATGSSRRLENNKAPGIETSSIETGFRWPCLLSLRGAEGDKAVSRRICGIIEIAASLRSSQRHRNLSDKVPQPESAGLAA